MATGSKGIGQLLETEPQLAEAYAILDKLHANLNAASRSKDMQAIDEVVKRLVQYGRLCEDIRPSWTVKERKSELHRTCTEAL